MKSDEFAKLKDTLVIRTLYRTYLPNDNLIEVAVADSGIVHYAAEMNRDGKFVAMRDDHPFAKGIIARSGVNFG